MLPPDRNHRTGAALVVAAAIAWSTAPFFTRLLPYDAWTILFWRGIFGGGAITLFLVVTQGGKGIRSLIALQASGWLVAALSTTGMVTFIPALQSTNVANVAIVIAAQPFVAAGISWVWLREAAARRTLWAGVFALVGIAIIVGDATRGGDYQGIALAAVMVIALSAMTVVIRKHREISMVAAAAVSNFLGSAICLPFAHQIVGLSSHDFMLVALFGLLQVGLGLTLFALGSRHLPSGQASLIATLETPLMPFWVWLAFGELPSLRTFIGGSIVLGAVIVEIMSDRRARTATPPHSSGSVVNSSG